MLILSAFVAYVVVDWCSVVDWDRWVSGVEWWFCLGSMGYRVCGGCQFGFDR